MTEEQRGIYDGDSGLSLEEGCARRNNIVPSRRLNELIAARKHDDDARLEYHRAIDAVVDVDVSVIMSSIKLPTRSISAKRRDRILECAP